jgi:uncharacterized protein
VAEVNTALSDGVGALLFYNLNAHGGPMKELVEEIARALVDHPEGVQVKAVEGSQVTVLELRVHPEDLGKVIGRQGRTAKAIRTLLGAAGMKLHKRFTLEILED